MKRILFLLCYLISMRAISQPTQKDIVTVVRAKVNAINAHIEDYKKVEKETYESTEGGVSVAFFNKHDLVKINATFYGETGKSVVEYYFENDKPLFIFEKQYSYYKPISIEPTRIRSTQENRLYYENGMLMRWIDDRHKEVPTSTKSFETASKVWTRDAEKQVLLFTFCK